MRIYHGSSYQGALDRCKEAAPTHSHGFCWTPYKMTPLDEPYILDNGAYHAYVNNVPWTGDGFVRRLGELPEMPRAPDFVVLPDVVAAPGATIERSRKWAQIIEHPTAMAVQDGHAPEEIIDVADELGAVGLFVGGTARWKRANAETFVEAAHDHGLRCHVARPNDLNWAKEIGADSADTTTVVTGSWHHLDKLEEQQTLAQSYS